MCLTSRLVCVMFRTVIENREGKAQAYRQPFLVLRRGQESLRLVRNMVATFRSVTSILDLARKRTTNTSEYIHKSRTAAVVNYMQYIGLNCPYQNSCVREPV